MTRRFAPWCLALALASPGLLASAQDTKRGAEAILTDLDAVKRPTLDPAKREDAGYIQTYIAEMRKAQEKRSELILELFQAEPKHERVPRLLIERWQTMMPVGPGAEALSKEIAEAVEKTGDATLKAEGAYVQARAKLYTARGDSDEFLAAVDAFAKAAPEDRRVPSLLFQAARMTEDTAKKTAIEDRILKDFPALADRIKGARRQREGVGKPFELEFQEAVTGKTITMADLKGKVVVVDFWATWCGPCVAEMPNMKEIYAKFHDKGVEFIGVSLDQPEDSGQGLTKLKEFVKEKEIAWPQYYQGKGWDSEFSRSWGIDSIPALFVVAPDGKLHSTEARGKLEEMIPALLEKAGKPDAGGE